MGTVSTTRSSGGRTNALIKLLVVAGCLGPSLQASPAQQKKLESGPPPIVPLTTAWTRSLGASPAAAPAFGSTAAFIPLETGDLVAVALTNGATLWTHKQPGTLSPVTDSERVFIAGDGVVDALSAETGAALWRVPLGGEVASRPSARGGWLILGLATGELRALRAETGEQIWSISLPAAIRLPPMIDGDRIYVAPTGQGVWNLDLKTGKTRWRRAMDGDGSALAVSGEQVFVGTTGRWFYALDDRNGHVRWRWRVGGEAVGVSFDDERVVILMLDHTMRAFHLDNGSQAWREPLLYRPYSGPLRANGSWLLTGVSPTVYAHAAVDGKPTGAYTPPGMGPASLQRLATAPHLHDPPGFAEDLLVLLTRQGVLHATRRRLVPDIEPLTALPGTVLSGPPPRAPAPQSPQPPAPRPPS